MTFHYRSLLCCSLFAFLTACGGGGGGSDTPVLQGPPASAATLAAMSAAEATQAVQAAVTSGDAVAAQQAGVASLFGPGAGSGGIALGGAPAARLEQPQAVETLPCGQWVDPGTTCTGSLTIETDIASEAVAAGNYMAFGFNALSGTLGGESISLNGTMRIDFETGFDGLNFAGTSFRITTIDLGGTANGISFGPESSVARFEFDAQGLVTVTFDGMSLRGFDALVVDDADDYSLGNGTLRRAYWGNVSGYVDYGFESWNVVAGRPQAGSIVTIIGSGGSITVEVAQSAPSAVVYDVQSSVGGVQRQFTVTATYSGNVPAYTVDEI